MKSFVSVLVACGSLTALSVLAACGDDSDDGGAGGGAGASSGGSSSGSGGKASGGASTGGASSGGASSGGASSGGASSGGSGGLGSGGGPGLHQVCTDREAHFEERQAELDCPNGVGIIRIACETILVVNPECEDELEALNACVAEEPIGSFECNTMGSVAAVDGTCPEETMAADDCATM